MGLSHGLKLFQLLCPPHTSHVIPTSRASIALIRNTLSFFQNLLQPLHRELPPECFEVMLLYLRMGMIIFPSMASHQFPLRVFTEEDMVENMGYQERQKRVDYPHTEQRLSIYHRVTMIERSYPHVRCR